MSRVRNQRTGKWIELPDADGMLWHPKLRRYIPLEQIKRAAEMRLREYDSQPVEKRWAQSIWGSLAKRHSARELQRSIPMAKTDATLNQFKCAGVEDELADLLGI